MVAYDDLGSLVPIKRTLQVIDYQNQANKESEVRAQIYLFSLGKCLTGIHGGEVIGFVAGLSESAPSPVFILDTWCWCGTG